MVTAEVFRPDSRHSALGQTRGLREAPLPYPAGWFALALSSAIRPGTLTTRRFMGRDVVVMRGESGTVSVFEAFCPHLGAHLGQGTVVEDEVRCPFHQFRFGLDGKCTRAPYVGGSPPNSLRLGVLRHQELAGVVFVFCGPPGVEPWKLDLGWGWEGSSSRVSLVGTDVQECTENSVDFGHFEALPEFEGFRVLQPVSTGGSVLTLKYRSQRSYPVIGSIEHRYALTVMGLGCSLVDIRVGRRMRVRQLILATPTDRSRSTVRIVLKAQSADDRPRSAPRRIIDRAVTRAFQEIAIRIVASEVAKDCVMWNSKAYLAKPGLATGDGPIGKYRRWARQFYSDETAPDGGEG